MHDELQVLCAVLGGGAVAVAGHTRESGPVNDRNVSGTRSRRAERTLNTNRFAAEDVTRFRCTSPIPALPPLLLIQPALSRNEPFTKRRITGAFHRCIDGRDVVFVVCGGASGSSVFEIFGSSVRMCQS